MDSQPSVDSLVNEAKAVYRDLLNTNLNDLIHKDTYTPVRELADGVQGMAETLHQEVGALLRQELNVARRQELLNRIVAALNAFADITSHFIQLSREVQQVGKKIQDVANGYLEASKRCEIAAKQLNDAEKEN
ncbi:hypothetical protein AAVH_08569 [Aphelenchoides avenae]|nr:hypothetical protein AAVH_08569 [Aphelenchus avenae]